jgi:hypothetical protein
MEGATLPNAPEGGKVRKLPISKIFRNDEFGYQTITVERPLRDPAVQGGAGREGQAKGQAAARQQPARHRERAAGRGHRGLLPETVSAEVHPRTRCVCPCVIGSLPGRAVCGKPHVRIFEGESRMAELLDHRRSSALITIALRKKQPEAPD